MCEQNSRIALFIDGTNLNATAKTLGLDIDYKRLRAFYYTAIIRTMSTCRSAL